MTLKKHSGPKGARVATHPKEIFCKISSDAAPTQAPQDQRVFLRSDVLSYTEL